mgnify:CR=1 FL=1
MNMRGVFLRTVSQVMTVLLTAALGAAPAFAQSAPPPLGQRVSLPVQPGPVALAMGDFNRDGFLDLAISSSGSSNVSILMGKGGGTFEQRSVVSVGGPSGPVAVGDLAGDGVPDLAVVQGPRLVVLIGDGQGGFRVGGEQKLPVMPWSIALGDINGDGKADVAVTFSAQKQWALYYGVGNGSFQFPVLFDLGRQPYAVAIADFNGDRMSDVALTGTAFVEIWLGNRDRPTSPTWGAPLVQGSVPITVAVGDVNGDGSWIWPSPVPWEASWRCSSGPVPGRFRHRR